MTTAGLPSRDVAAPVVRHSGQVAYLFAFDSLLFIIDLVILVLVGS